MYDYAHAYYHSLFGNELLDKSKVFRWGRFRVSEHNEWYCYTDESIKCFIYHFGGRIITFNDVCIGRIFSALNDPEKELFLEEYEEIWEKLLEGSCG